MATVPLTEFGPPNNTTTTALAASLVVKATTGILYGLSGYNSKASAQYIQLHDAASLPANAVVPILNMPVAAKSFFSFDFGYHGREFLTGIVVCNSSTDTTLTVGSADCFFDGQAQ